MTTPRSSPAMFVHQGQMTLSYEDAYDAKGPERITVSVEISDLFGNAHAGNLAELMRRASLRDEGGYNYLEAWVPGEDDRALSIFFNGDHAVVACFLPDDDPGIQMLDGDGSVRPDAIMDFFMPGSPQEFSGEVIVSAATAGNFLRAFATGAPWPEKPGWTDKL